MNPPRPLRAAQGPDGRLCVLLAALTGVLVWKTSLPGLILYLLLLAAALAVPFVRGRMSPGTIRRSLIFALIWPMLKLLADGAALAWNSREALASAVTALLHGERGVRGVREVSGVSGDGGAQSMAALADALGALSPSAQDAGLLFLRLLVVMFLGLALTLALSPPSLARAVSGLLRPFCGRRAWTLGLALSLMLRYVPRIHALAAQTRQAALARGLPASGPAWRRLALPHMFRVLARDTYSQALGLAARDLGRAEAWRDGPPPPAAQIAAALALAGAVLAASFF